MPPTRNEAITIQVLRGPLLQKNICLIQKHYCVPGGSEPENSVQLCFNGIDIDAEIAASDHIQGLLRLFCNALWLLSASDLVDLGWALTSSNSFAYPSGSVQQKDHTFSLSSNYIVESRAIAPV